MIERAYAHRDHLTDYERLMTLGTYWDDGPHYDRVKSIDAYERVTQRYPDDYSSWLNLANLYASRGDYERADSAFHRSALTGTSTFATFNPIFLSLTRGRPDEARKRLDLARQVFARNPRVTQAENAILYAEGKYDSAYATFAGMRMPGGQVARGQAALFQSRFDLMLGRLSTARRSMAEFSAGETARGVSRASLNAVMDSVEIDAWYLGRSADALKALDGTLARTPIASLPPRDRPYFRATYLYSLLGRPDRARAVLAEYDAEVRDTARKRVDLPERHTALGWIALADRKPLVAVAELRRGDSLPDGPVQACPGCIGATLGRAFDAANMPDSAIAAYTSYVDGAPPAQKLFIDALHLGPALKRLGELLEAKGDRAKAATYYQRFVDLWRSADPELQQHVSEVRRRLARLSESAEKR
jgi:tetratricopeptide (TPR) repeat protein